jgi:acyl-CoA synthetase (AMP-forming)/AMP-acid ligase II
MERRASDRWITPGVIIAGLMGACLIVLAAIGGVVYLSSIGKDPDPMLRLAAQVATGVGALGTFVLQLAGRSTVAKVERNTGVLANEQARTAEVVETLASDPGRHTYLPGDTSFLPPVPPPARDTARHPVLPGT